MALSGAGAAAPSVDDLLSHMAHEAARLRRAGSHRAVAAAIARVHAAQAWPTLSGLLQLLSLACLFANADADGLHESLAAPLPDGTTLVQTLFRLVGETQEQIPHGYPFKKGGELTGASPRGVRA